MGIFLFIKGILAPAKIFAAMVSAFQFFILHWKTICITLMIGLIFHQNFMETELFKWMGIRTVPGLVQEHRAEVADLNLSLEVCEESRTNLQTAITTTNAQIEQWAELSADLQDRQDDLIQELADLRKQSEQDVQDILSGPTPETCEDAFEYLKDGTGDLQW